MLEKYSLHIVKSLLALFMLAGGISKLMGVPHVLESFTILGLPSWFGYFIGCCEIVGAIGLFIAPLSTLAASGLAVIMMGAAYFHLFYTPPVDALRAIIALVMCVFIALKQRHLMLNFK